MVWDEGTIAHLRDLWTQGLSTAEIGRRLGVSKNAIVGKAHRLDLDARPSPIRRLPDKPLDEFSPPYARAAGPTLPPLASAEVHPLPPPRPAIYPKPAVRTFYDSPSDTRPDVRIDDASRSHPAAARPAQPAITIAPPPRAVMPSVTIQARRSAPSCCWPIGEPGTKTFRFCDDTSVPGKPYCDEHARLAYVKIRDRKEDAA